MKTLTKFHKAFLKTIPLDEFAYLAGKTPKQGQLEAIKLHIRIIKKDAKNCEYFENKGKKILNEKI